MESLPGRGGDRASFIRELLAKGLAREGRLSLSEAAEKLDLDPWTGFDLLRRRNEPLNIQLEDWIDSRPAL